MPPWRGPDSAARPASTAAASEAPVEAVTRAAKVEALSSWSASSTSARRIASHRSRGARQARPSRSWIAPASSSRCTWPSGPATAAAIRSSSCAASLARSAALRPCAGGSASARSGEGGEGARSRGRPSRRGLALVRRQAEAAAQQPRHRLQRRRVRQPHRVLAAVVEPPALHRGDRRGQHRLAPGDRGDGDVGGLAAARLALGERARRRWRDSGCGAARPDPALRAPGRG